MCGCMHVATRKIGRSKSWSMQRMKLKPKKCELFIHLSTCAMSIVCGDRRSVWGEKWIAWVMTSDLQARTRQRQWQKHMKSIASIHASFYLKLSKKGCVCSYQHHLNQFLRSRPHLQGEFVATLCLTIKWSFCLGVYNDAEGHTVNNMSPPWSSKVPSPGRCNERNWSRRNVDLFIHLSTCAMSIVCGYRRSVWGGKWIAWMIRSDWQARP